MFCRRSECHRGKRSIALFEYVLKVKERLELARELVEKNMTEAQEHQKK